MTNLARKLQPTATHSLRLLTAMPEDQDPRETDTIAPDTDRANRETLPPGEADVEASRAAATMLPAAPSLAPPPAPPEYWKAAYDKLCEVHEDAKRDRLSRQEREDALVVRFAAAAKEASDANRDNITTAISEIARSVESIGEKLVKLEDSDSEQSKELKELRAELDSIKRAMRENAEQQLKEVDRITKVERRLDDQQNVPRPPQTPPTG
jgi:DNA repair exonuclease SbcCD ATPase subunit